ncbi:MAG: hypothetical protein WEC59_04520 [Salibacteraceae bacterium]
MKAIVITLFVTFSAMLFSYQHAQAQCKAFTKKKCLDVLEGYTGNGQYNGAVMFEGEEATLSQTFYSGKEYRLFVCAYPSIKDSIYFEVTDYRKELLYSSKGKDEQIFDFSVESTQQLYVRMIVPKMGTSNELKKNGCVSVLVGFK